MITVETKLAESLSSTSTELIPFLPYLLQDLFELGSSPNDMLQIIQKHLPNPHRLKVLDLACGKGAVSICLAKTLNCQVKGIDLMPDFIEVAKSVAIKEQIEAYCRFEVGDINQSVRIEKDYDLVIYGAVWTVLGTPEETLNKLSKTLKAGGYVLLVDGYSLIEHNPPYLTRDAWLSVIQKAGFRLVAEIMSDETFEVVLDEQIQMISKRVFELCNQYPDQRNLFLDYLKNQETEVEMLTTDLKGVTLLLKKQR
ncbi:class I SAM-dependent methyltransferase [Methanobacterium sp. YSL]|nr:class I SAM-dependent methyltransferase [Methanobacterium sp. YSL]